VSPPLPLSLSPCLLLHLLGARVSRTILCRYQNSHRRAVGYCTSIDSYARGTARPDSDVDTVIALAGSVQPYQELARLSQTLSDLCLQYDLLIVTYPIPETWLRERESPLLENIRREGVLL